MVKRAPKSRSVAEHPSAAPLTSKAARTKECIVEAALELFRDKGYEATTMRMVAERAGVSVGNAYYYFASKELLLQAFYTEIHEAHVALARPLLAKERDTKKRLMVVMQAKLEVTEPYHRFAGLMFRTAADPKSPLNPFSAESSDVRERATELMARVVAGSDTRFPSDLEAELPRLLWLYEMAVILFWIHDESEDRRRTHLLIERTADLVARLAALASFRLLAAVRKATLKLLDELRAE